MIPLTNGRAAWMCPACLTHNFAEEPRCLVCDRPQGDFSEMATNTKTKAKPKTAQAKPTANGKPNTSEPALREIPIDEIVPSGDNPRKYFDETALKKLADSLKREGQMQNVVVYKHPERVGLELIAGERRWRAARIAGLKTLLCKVVDVTEEEAIQMRGRENEDRENFSAFELARWYQQLQDHCGMSQRAIAKFVGVSQGQVGNTLALLKLPEDWERKVNTQEITPTCLRHLAPWSHRPQVLEAVAVGIKDRDADEELTVEEFRRIVDEAARQQSRSIDSWSMQFEMTADLRGELDLEEVPGRWGGKEQRAFNAKLYDKLQKEAKKAQKEKAKAAESQKPKPKVKSSGPSEMELQELWLRWWRISFAEKLRAKLTKAQKAVAWQFAFCLAVRSPDFGGELAAQWTGRKAWEMDAVTHLAELERDAFDKGLFEHLPVILDGESIYWDGDEYEVMERFAHVFGIDPERDWEPEFEWLDLLTVEQLRRLPAADLVPTDYFASLEKPDLIERLLEKWPQGRGVPAVFRLPEGGV